MKSLIAPAAAFVLAACAAAPNAAPAPSGQWRIVRIGGQALPESSRASLEFDAAEKRFSGYADCNRLFGGYEQNGRTLRFSAVASTLMMCEPEQMAREQALSRALENTAAYSLDSRTLKLLDQQGNTLVEAENAAKP